MSVLAESKRDGLARVRQQGNQAATKVSAARAAAFEVLLLVGENRGHSDELLHGRLLRPLAAADKNLAMALVLGVLRWQIALDARVRPLLQRPNAALPAPVAIALRLGAFQLLHMDRIPPHAALSESVELAKYAGHTHAAGMVNAVLRKLSTAAKPGVKLHESTAAFAERLGHPLWLVERWVAEYGRSAALAICEAGQREPDCGSLFAAEQDGDAPMPVMDDGSRLVAEVAAACMPQARRVWDCCAAPGGKALVLAQRLPQASLLATDASPRRLQSLATRLREAAVLVETAEADAVELPEAHGEFDLILCDVPCSGTGTMARNPEIRHRVRPEDLTRQADRQRAILNAAFGRLAPGGRLVYATCSLEREENEGVIEKVFAAWKSDRRVQRVDVRAPLEKLAAEGRFAGMVDLASLTRGEFLRTLPRIRSNESGFEGDGFFAAVFERVR